MSAKPSVMFPQLDREQQATAAVKVEVEKQDSTYAYLSVIPYAKNLTELMCVSERKKKENVHRTTARRGGEYRKIPVYVMQA